jgi:hypothetical protein
MINNSININKVNNHLSPKESLKSDDQQLYQYQPSKQPPVKPLNTKKTMTYGKVCFHFVDIDRVVDHHCLNFL